MKITTTKVSCYLPIEIYTEQKNFTFNCLKVSDSDLNWLSLLEESRIIFESITRKKNVVSDTVSWLDIDELKIPQIQALTIL
jgi:hypothetical protein